MKWEKSEIKSRKILKGKRRSKRKMEGGDGLIQTRLMFQHSEHDSREKVNTTRMILSREKTNYLGKMGEENRKGNIGKRKYKGDPSQLQSNNWQKRVKESN